MRIPRSLLILAPLLGLLLFASAASAQAGQPCPSTLNPPPPSFETCQTVGGGTIASGSRVVSNPLADAGITCGTGADAFDIFNQDTFDQHATRWYDQNGNLTRRVIHDKYSFGQWSNPITAATVNYTQNNIQTDVLAVPGDLTSSTETITGENIYRTGTGAPVLIATGRQVFNFDSSELISSAGRNGFIAAFFQGDGTAFDKVCAALAS